MNTIDCTPTWEALLPVMLDLVKQGKDSEHLKSEFLKMAKAADKYIAEIKQSVEKLKP